MNAPGPGRPVVAVRAGGPARHQGFLSLERFRWARVALALSALAALLYLVDDPWPRPNGGTALGYALGTAGALLILWLSAIGIRKRHYADGNWSLKAWVSAHVWLGLALAVIATLHTGFQFGWNVHTLAYALMMLVIGSGLWGVWLYHRLPQQLSAARAETSERAMAAALAENAGALADSARRLPDDEAALVEAAIRTPTVAPALWPRLAGRVPGCGTARALARLAPSGPEAEAVRALLETRAQLLARARATARLKSWLQLWLLVHVPATVALLAALVVHILSVFLYW